MPNWTENRITIQGPEEEITRLRENFCGEDGVLDFEKLIPKPEGFNAELPAGTGDEAYDVVYRPGVAFARYANYPWVKEAGVTTPEELKAHLAGRYETGNYKVGGFDTYEALAAAYKQNIDLTGCKNWYEWNTSNWGTKWRACDGDATFEKDTATFSFNTAWNAPIPIFEALAHEFPKCFIDINCRDEDGFGGYGFNFEPQVVEDEA